MLDTYGSTRELRFLDKLKDVNWLLIALIAAIASIGFAMLYSVAGGTFEPRASRQMIIFGVGIAILMMVALIDLRVWMRLAYPAYAASLLLLVVVELFGKMGMGAERWIDLYVFQLQPSELMKITLILAMARYLHSLTLDEVSRPLTLIAPLALIGLPVILVLMQPNLGTATILGAVGASLLFVAGLSWKWILPALGAVAAAIPVGWQFLHDYQKQRIFTFLDPDRDPLGAGYNILQSKIAIGSGGVFGKGYMLGSQSQLNFLPEKHTDFIFTTLGEEFGLVGAVTLLLLYLCVLTIGMAIAYSSRSHFGRLLAFGVCVNFVLYILINVSMVMGVIPVVGIPLPLVSYGGTAMLTVLFGFGLLMCAHLHRNVDVPRHSGAFW